MWVWDVSESTRIINMRVFEVFFWSLVLLYPWNRLRYCGSEIFLSLLLPYLWECKKCADSLESTVIVPLRTFEILWVWDLLLYLSECMRCVESLSLLLLYLWERLRCCEPEIFLGLLLPLLYLWECMRCEVILVYSNCTSESVWDAVSLRCSLSSSISFSLCLRYSGEGPGCGGDCMTFSTRSDTAAFITASWRSLSAVCTIFLM